MANRSRKNPAYTADVTIPAEPGSPRTAALVLIAAAQLMVVLDTNATDFTGPVGGSGADPGQLARICWALALLTEMYRNPMAAIQGPLGRFQGYRASAGERLSLASPAAVGRLAAFREVFASALLPALGRRVGGCSHEQ